jgi:uncharacterized protein (DUF2236 family)
MYETMVRPLSEGEREALWQDYVRFGELFGLHATPHALEMAPLVAFEQPVPAPARGNLVVQNLIVKGTLPPRVREIFGVRWSGAHERAFRTAAAAHRRARPAFPRQMRRGRNDVFFDVVSKAERLRGGTVTPELRASAG